MKICQRYVYKESAVSIRILTVGILGLLTSFVQIFAGQIDAARPLFKADLPDIPKATLLCSV